MAEVGIAIDMGGTIIKFGIVREGVIVSHRSVPAGSHSSLLQKLSEIGEQVDQMLAEGNYSPFGIGIALPAIVDPYSGKILSKYVKYPDAQDLNLIQWAQARWNIPLVLENDARAALRGEWKYGAGRKHNDLALVTLGTGFGSAVIMNGKLLRGRNHLAGNLAGHMTINIHGELCNCGNIGCLETESSSWAIGNYIRSLPRYNESGYNGNEELSFRTIFNSAIQGDKFMANVMEHCLKVWSVGIISLVHAYDPEVIILGGGVMKSKEVIIPYVKKMIANHSWVKDGSLEIVAATEVEFAGILGLYDQLKNYRQNGIETY